MSDEKAAGVKPAHENWRVRVTIDNTAWLMPRDHGAPMLARVTGMAWVEQQLLFPLRTTSLDWVAKNGETCTAYWGDRVLATVTVFRP